MKLSELKIAKGSTHPTKRVGLGIGSGMGKTSTRGQKGAGARSGAGTRPGFEGGQNPIYRRLPKRGFHNRGRVEYAVINLSQIAALGFKDGEEVDTALYISDRKDGIKVLGDGELAVKLTIVADAFSASAKEKIEKAGGVAKVR
ncbi:MAG: 50S ribosomal protein L15 [Bacilli bacterium]|jgi:large subunit ribosomal protein L15|nr:50S ribosomal protein L15 [Bacilli bacterium]